MAATASQIARFRSYVGDPGGVTPVWTDAEINALFDEAAEENPTGSGSASMAYAVRGALLIYMSNAAKRASYSQATSSESVSDIFRNWEALYKLWDDRLTTALNDGAGQSQARFGGFHKFPTREVEWPDA